MLRSVALDPQTHKRFLDYRDRHKYFGKRLQLLSMAEFEAADREQRALDAKGEEARDDEEQARYAELTRILLRD
jgi:hypothetical protein